MALPACLVSVRKGAVEEGTGSAVILLLYTELRKGKSCARSHASIQITEDAEAKAGSL